MNIKENIETHFDVFKQILENYVELDVDVNADTLWTLLCVGDRYGKFTVTTFEQVDESLFKFGWKNVAALSGGGRTELYEFQSDGNVSFHSILTGFRS